MKKRIWSNSSKNKLDSCHQKLQDLFNAVLLGYDCSILEGHRGKQAQNRLFADKLSKIEWPNGKHNKEISEGIDVAPYPIDWKDTKRFYHFAGYVKATADQMGIKIRWGGDWDQDNDLNDQKFMDLVHFEIV